MNDIRGWSPQQSSTIGSKLNPPSWTLSSCHGEYDVPAFGRISPTIIIGVGKTPFCYVFFPSFECHFFDLECLHFVNSLPHTLHNLLFSCFASTLLLIRLEHTSINRAVWNHRGPHDTPFDFSNSRPVGRCCCGLEETAAVKRRLGWDCGKKPCLVSQKWLG